MIINGPADYEYCEQCEQNRDCGDMAKVDYEDDPICQECLDEINQMELKL